MAIASESAGARAGRRALKLDGHVAIVTGSDSGMGQAIAEAFASEGASVAVTFHTDEAGAKITADQVQAAGRQAMSQHLDVGNEASVESLFEAVSHELGEPDILVNSAGMGSTGKTLSETSAQEFDAVLRPISMARSFVVASSFDGVKRLAVWARSSTSPPCMRPSRAQVAPDQEGSATKH